MKQILTIGAVALAVAALACGNAKKKKRVDLADLATMDSVTLEGLKDEQHAISTARIHEAAARDGEQLAKSALKGAQRELDAQQADRKAAEAELKAAKKNEDAGRTERASALIQKTADELASAKQLVRWRKQALEAADARTKAAKALLELRQAELEATRARLITESGGAPAEKYDVADFDVKARSLQGSYEKAQTRAQSAASRAEQQRLSWRSNASASDQERFDPREPDEEP